MLKSNRSHAASNFLLCAAACGLMALGGCATPGQIAVGLVGVPFEVAKFTATQTAIMPIAAAEIGARGVVSVVIH